MQKECHFIGISQRSDKDACKLVKNEYNKMFELDTPHSTIDPDAQQNVHDPVYENLKQFR
jgi:hypothetical protein